MSYHIYNKILESKYAENIESEILHVPFYLNHQMKKSFSELRNPSPFLRSAKHPGDSVDIGKEISAYVTKHFMEKIILKDMLVHDAYIIILEKQQLNQELGDKRYPLTMAYFVNETPSSLYADNNVVAREISSSDTILFNPNEVKVSLDVRGTQAVIVAHMEEING